VAAVMECKRKKPLLCKLAPAERKTKDPLVQVSPRRAQNKSPSWTS